MTSRLRDWLTGVPAEHPTADLLPSRITSDPLHEGPRFRDDGEVGRGASSLVRLVYDTVLLRYTAVKVLVSEVPGARSRFLAEAQITGQLEHPNIVPVHEYGTDDEDRDFIQMKLVAGESFADRIHDLGDARLSPEPLDGLLTALVKVCDAVAYAHSRGVIHRDIKPGNVMIGEFGEVYLVDWGIARVGGSVPAAAPVRTSVALDGDISGTPSFMAPEQIRGISEEIDERADVYALGGLLYAILTGQPPNRGESAIEILNNALAGNVRPPQLGPPSLVRIAMQALSLRPADRQHTALAFRADLEKFRRGAWHLPTRTVPAGTRLIVEGEHGDEAYVLVRGRCRVSTAARGVVRELTAGDVFGEMAVLSDRVRSATVEAIDEVTVQVVTRTALEGGLGLDSWTGRFVRTLVERFAELDARLDRA